MPSLSHSRLPFCRLRELNVSECQIELISMEGKSGLFPSLKKLNLSSNKVDSWIDVAELRHLRSLNDLNLKGNPVIAGVADYAASFNLVLGRLSGLVKLNGELVSEMMYREAEKYYVKVACKESTKASPGKEFEAAHPRLKDLLQSEFVSFVFKGRLYLEPKFGHKQTLKHLKNQLNSSIYISSPRCT